MPSSPENGIQPQSFPSILCIAGLDPSGGAGLLADARACAAFGTHCLGVNTAVVVQNTRGVVQVEAVPPEIIAAQIETLLADIRPAAVKIGMIPGLAAAEAIVESLRPLHGEIPIVIDTVFAPSTGSAFNDAAAIEAIGSRLLPLATLVTPNLMEAEQLGGGVASDMREMAEICLRLRDRIGAVSILLKGGHLSTTDEELAHLSVDLLFDGRQIMELRALRESRYEVRGTGCQLASAIAAQLGSGQELVESVRAAKLWLTQQIRSAQAIGRGRRVTAG